VSYRPWLEGSALRQMAGLPDEALSTLVLVLAQITDDPWDRMVSMPLTKDGLRRMAELGDHGFIEFLVDENAGMIRVYYLVWTG
jgi:hypothetical protein